ncbi:hypothetical protein NT6N_33010 [Oceaniferula spumae]|uniref:RND transporter n=1 Tax=Oceaniferula spumae TaxID=2979115 RepID=A0AAT9FQG3_9BACT
MKNLISYRGAGALLTLLLMVTGCSLPSTDLAKPDASVPSNYRYAPTKNGKRAAVSDKWWRSFGDSGLNSLMTQVRTGNRDLRGGMKRIEQARALVDSTRSGRIPRVSSSPTASRDKTSGEVVRGSSVGSQEGYISNNYTLPVSVDWELDLFGRIRRGEDAAKADAQAAEEDYLALRLSLETQTAAAYFSLRALDSEIGIVREGVKSRKSSLKLANDRKDLGVVSELDVAQAQALLATSEADLAALLRQRAAQVSAIAVLVGKPASSFSLAPRGLTGRPPSVPAGIPSELARARPDIRRAERRLAAENARVGVAVASFYPSISLSGRMGLQASDISDLFTKGAQFWGIGPSVYLPIFRGGQGRADLRRSKARYEEVLESYQQTVLESLAEVETALSAAKHYRSQVSAQNRVVTASAQARDIAKAQYEGGTVSYLSVLDAERTSLNGEREQARLKGAEFVNTVQLIRSLGGRW